MGRASSTTPWLVALLAALLGAWWRHASSTNRIPAHMLGHTITATPDIMDRATQQELLELLRQFGRAEGGIRTLDKDASSTKPTHEHVGEALPLASGAGAACAHRLMVPSADRSQCTLPQRLDIAKHFLTFGGTAALKERYAVSVGRLLSFGTYIFNPEAYPPIKRLFSSEKFLAAARGVCPRGKQHLDPFQFNIIVQLPGQTVATHIDGAYFWGASRFHVPQVRAPRLDRRPWHSPPPRPAPDCPLDVPPFPSPTVRAPPPAAVAARRDGLLGAVQGSLRRPGASAPD